jgi:hypothetical protein
MNKKISLFTLITIGCICSLMVAAPLAAVVDGSDHAFNREIGKMKGRDTGSMWFDYYLEVLNQEISSKKRVEPFGAAGPEGPVSGFDGYLESFMAPDTGSTWFNNYVDRVNHVIQDKQRSDNR